MKDGGEGVGGIIRGTALKLEGGDLASCIKK